MSKGSNNGKNNNKSSNKNNNKNNNKNIEFTTGRMTILASNMEDPFENYIEPVKMEIFVNASKKSGKQITEAEAYRRLGQMYFDGNLGEKNGPKGCRFLEIAYEKGSRDIRTGDYLLTGVYRHIATKEAAEQGITRNLDLAIRWYTKCLNKCRRFDNKESALLLYSHLGRVYQDDEIKDYKKAYRYLMKACHQEAEALFYLARMYDRGYYVKENREKAQEYLNKILTTPGFEDTVFYDSAKIILECWEMGVPDEIIDEIVYELG